MAGKIIPRIRLTSAKVLVEVEAEAELGKTKLRGLLSLKTFLFL